MSLRQRNYFDFSRLKNKKRRVTYKSPVIFYRSKKCQKVKEHTVAKKEGHRRRNDWRRQFIVVAVVATNNDYFEHHNKRHCVLQTQI